MAPKMTSDRGCWSAELYRMDVLKVPTFDGHLNQSNTDGRRWFDAHTPRRKLTREFKLEAVRQVAR
jgi:hypothetical protein